MFTVVYKQSRAWPGQFKEPIARLLGGRGKWDDLEPAFVFSTRKLERRVQRGTEEGPWGRGAKSESARESLSERRGIWAVTKMLLLCFFRSV